MKEKQNNDDYIPGQLLNTGFIAKYCHVSVVQINRWIKSGKLKAFRNPGGRYRVSKKYFKEFLQEHGMPVMEEFFKDDRPRKILIADDEDTVVEVIRDILSDNFEDIELKTARDGYEALITAGSFNPHLLILDMRMPDLSGLDVCRILKGKPETKDIPIIMLSERGQAKEREEGLAAGANRYITKPFDDDDLILTINELTGGYG